MIPPRLVSGPEHDLPLDRTTRHEGGGVRVLQSFPHKIGAGRICSTAWQQANGVAAAGGQVTVFTGAVQRKLPPAVHVHTTLARGRWRIPYTALGVLRALRWHDRIVARALPRFSDRVDIVHVWPLAALETLQAARRLGIPTVVERPNAHTRFAYEVVARECERLGVSLPSNHEHAYNAARLTREEAEYELADRLLCPSEFVAQSFLQRGFSAEKLVRHRYGYDERRYFPAPGERPRGSGLVALFAGVCAVRKGLHFALEAWLRSPASRRGKFLIAGDFVAAYRTRLDEMLAHPSVQVLGHVDDLPSLMRAADVLLLPSLEEGSPLVCLEAIGSGCVPLVSEVCSGACAHERNALVHRVGDVASLTQDLTTLDRDRAHLMALRAEGLAHAGELTWTAAGRRLHDAYVEVARDFRPARTAGKPIAAMAG